MSFRNRFVLPVIALSFLALLAGCGSGAHNPVAPPAGSWSDTNFNGTYTFSVLGADVNGPFAMAGTLNACGCSGGTIASGGSVELIDPSGATTLSTISGGTYNVTKDGRGKANLSISTPSGNLQVTLDFVLSSSSHGLVTRYDGNGTGSGTIDLQPSAVSQSALAGSYAFSLSGSDLNGNPLATVGALTLDSAGNISTTGSTAGVEDFTYYSIAAFGSTPYPNLPLSGTVLVDTTGAVLATSFGVFTFDVFAIDSTHLKLIENDGQAILVGDVFSQPTATIPSGNLVFTMAGLDSSEVPFAAGGLMSSDGTSLILSGSEDVNDGGLVDGGTTTPASFSGFFAATGGGRFQMNLTSFGGGTLFAAYPSSGGLLMLEVDSGLGAGITGGSALAQTSTSFATPPQGYGFNMTGVDGNGNLDLIAEFASTSTGFTGLLDENEGAVAGSPKNLSGTYSLGTAGFGSANFNAGLQSMFFYMADSSTAVFISTDPNQVGVGSFELQSTPSAAQAAVVERHLAMLRSVTRPHLAKRRVQKKLGK